MQPFEYASPKTLKEALGLLGAGWDDAVVLAGGTDLISLMKDGVVAPKRVVNIKEIAELKGVTKTAAGVKIGALVTVDEVLTNALVRASAPALVEAAKGVSSAQIRNMGTVGGDLCQRPRCWFFRAGFGLIAKHDGKDLAVEGDNRYHAIFGDGPARFVSASSFGPALVALGAKVEISSASGKREVEAAKFFVAPASSEQHEVDVKPNEIVTAVVIPNAVTKNATYEVRQKEALDWPLATASVALTMKGTAVGSAKIVLGHVAPTPYVAEKAAAMLAGKTITAETAEAAGKAAVESAKPLSMNAYKVQIAATAVKRALLAAAGVKA
ncbi:MAG: xanthine dehydrogenase family protein subunit M [Acidobacteria bacterium]|nr:xanthine dehydrogenase family protein subunit M [Acidobacteriota bacterium]